MLSDVKARASDLICASLLAGSSDGTYGNNLLRFFWNTSVPRLRRLLTSAIRKWKDTTGENLPPNKAKHTSVDSKEGYQTYPLVDILI